MTTTFTDDGTGASSLEHLAYEIYKLLDIQVDPIPDGRFHRYPAPGKPDTNDACWVWISEDGNYAKFGNFITGETHTWKGGLFQPLSPEEAAALQAQAKEAAIQAYREKRQRQEQAAMKAQAMIKGAKRATHANPYLSQKSIEPHGTFADGAVLLVPMVNLDSEIRNIQRIYPNRDKRFLKGGQVNGLFTTVDALFSAETQYICEGLATAATVNELTYKPVAAAMTAANLKAVCLALARVAPKGVEIVVVADNDHRTEGNPGVTRAKEAARAIGARVVIPPLPCDRRDCYCTDFNDYWNCSNRLLVADNG